MRPHFNSPVSVFSPGGRLLQVEFAQNSVQKGSTAVGIRCHSCVVLALEQKTLMPQQMEGTVQRIFPVDKNVIMTFAGITPDAHVLVDRARYECSKQRPVYNENPLSVKQVAECIADLQLKHTQAPDCRPFGVSCLVAGYDPDVKARLYQTDPYGNCHEYRAIAIGRHSQSAQAYLERRYTENFVSSRHRVIKLAIGALLQASQPENTNFEVTLLKRNNQLVKLEKDTVAEYVGSIDRYS